MPNTLRNVRRMAAEILKVGENRVWIDPENINRALDAITREDVKALIKEKIIKKKPEKGISRRKKKGKRGPGSRKGSRISDKRKWIMKVRAQRKFIKLLRKKKIITKSTYRMLYRMIKGSAFASVAQIKSYIIEKNLARRR
ncbi:MAG: 50S ribosomal protein L19e [Candidatus Methanomethylicia archaeon]|nr:50S ribosomal protein L19e [Candidatus Methanomethylicia archaeon]MCX8168959.1 50S ribosomal protein L19e [Candidatus Methanomethylicia archaeon]MDW7988691.1 50S ribosomal protein L19e [Nitrososphaerota archaeon]